MAPAGESADIGPAAAPTATYASQLSITMAPSPIRGRTSEARANPYGEDHSVVRGGLKQFLSSAPELAFAAEADTGSEAMALLERQRFDLVLLDLALPDLDGLEVLRRIKRKFPALPVLIFSM